MKNLIIALLCIITLNTYAQVSISNSSSFTPTETLDVDGTFRANGNVYIGTTSGTNNDIYVSDDIIDWDNSTYRLDIGSNSRMNEVNFDDGSKTDPSVYFEDTNTGFFAPGAGQIALSINGTETIRVTTSRNVGIGTTTPDSKVTVTGGDVYVTDIGDGVIMKSPDGNCWRMNVSNAGVVSATSITCP
jgi:hypothetical protein